MKKLVSILMAVLMLSTIGTIAVSSAGADEVTTVNGVVANVGDTVTIDCYLTSDCIWEDFEGHLTYDYDGLQVESFSMPDVKNGIITNTTLKGFVYYTGVDINDNYKFNKEVHFYSVKFTVLQAGKYTVENVWVNADGNYADSIVNDGVIVDASRLITREVVTVIPKPTETTTTKPQPTTTKPQPTTTKPAETTTTNPVPTNPVEPVLVNSIILSKTSATVNVGKTVTISATVNPANADKKDLVWASSDTKVAIVQNGVIKGVKAGKSVVTAKSTDGSNIVASCVVTVKQPVTSISMTKKATVYTGKKLTLKATVKPSNASNKTLTWKSSNVKVAKVNSKGVVTPVKAGTAKITATAKDGSKKSATCTVTVRQSVTKITLNKTSVSLAKKGASYKLKATVKPSNAYNKKMTVKSANTKIAKVSASTVNSGKTVTVTAVKKGSTKVTFTAKDGSKKSATCKITVKK